MQKRPIAKGTMTRDAAEAVGLQALLFMTSDETRLGRFLAETGIGPDELRGRAGEPEILAAMLGHLLSDESSLLAFTANAGLSPVDVHAANRALGGDQPWDSV